VIIQLIHNNVMVQVHISINRNMMPINNQQSEQNKFQIMEQLIRIIHNHIQMIIRRIDRFIIKIQVMMIIQMNNNNIQNLLQQHILDLLDERIVIIIYNQLKDKLE